MNYEYIFDVKGLIVPRTADLEMLAAFADEFVETTPTMTERLRNNLEDRLELERALRSLASQLNGLGARWLQNEADNILKLIPRIDLKTCEKKVQPFIANLLALSIEIQTAKFRSGAAKGEDQETNTIEYYTNIQRNLHAVLELAASADYRSALDIVDNMSVLTEDETGRVLKSALRSKRDPSGLIAELIEKYECLIEEIRGEQVGAQKMILIVDDRPDILETVSGYLRDIYKVFALTGGISALKFLESQKPDLFILDIDMPDMDGITLARNIRNMAEHRETPIMILTSNATKFYVQSALKAGVNDFFVKPVSRDMLIAKISKYF